jgi:hypothetical protein
VTKFRKVASMALAILAVSAMSFAAGEQKVAGKVKAVSGATVTVVADDGNEWTFQTAQGARVIAPGGHHKSDALTAAGDKKTIDHFVRENQRVTVQYREQGGTRYIETLRVL